MENIVISYLNSKRKPVSKIGSSEKFNTEIASVANHISSLYFQAAKKQDVGLLRTIDAELPLSVNQYLQSMDSNYSTKKMADIIVKRVKLQLIMKTFKQKEVPQSVFNTLYNALSWMKDKSALYTDIIPSNFNVRDEFIKPEFISETEAASLLLSNVTMRDKLEERASLLRNLSPAVRLNRKLMLLADLANCHVALQSLGCYQTILEKEGVTFSSSDLNFGALAAYALSTDDLMEYAKSIIQEPRFVQSLDYHVDRVNSSTSLTQLLMLAKEFDRHITHQVSKVPFDTDTSDAKLQYLNSEVVIFESIAKKLDSFCQAMVSDFSTVSDKVSCDTLCTKLIEFFSFQSSSAVQKTIHPIDRNRFSIANQNTHFKHLPVLLARLYGNINAGSQLEILGKFARQLPVKVSTSFLLETPLAKQDMAWYLCEAWLAKDNHWRPYEMKNIGELLGAARLNHDDVMDEVISNAELLQSGCLSLKHFSTPPSIGSIAKDAFCTDVFNNLNAMIDVKRNQLMVKETATLIASAKTAQQADLSFMTGMPI